MVCGMNDLSSHCLALEELHTDTRWTCPHSTALLLFPSNASFCVFLPSPLQPPKVQQKSKEQKMAAAMAGGKSKKKVSDLR